MTRLWFDGILRDADTALIDPTDRGFTLGDGAFETIRIADGRAVGLAAHLDRLGRSLAVLGFGSPHGDAAIAAAIADLVAEEGVADGAARLTVTRGPAARGILPPDDPRPTVAITVSPGLQSSTPLRLTVARSTRRNEFSPLSRIKSLNYLDNILARREAAERGYDDAILLNTSGRVTETGIANLFLCHGDAIVTPPAEEGALPGLMRARVIDCLGAVERPIGTGELHRAAAAFVTNSLGIRAVAEIDGHVLAEAPPIHRVRTAFGFAART
jgi:branched-chain amino acid aminotransferase